MIVRDVVDAVELEAASVWVPPNFYCNVPFPTLRPTPLSALEITVITVWLGAIVVGLLIWIGRTR